MKSFDRSYGLDIVHYENFPLMLDCPLTRCVCVHSCPNMAVLQAEEDDALDEDKTEDQKEEAMTPAKASHRFKKQKVHYYNTSMSMLTCA